jgi:site-specific DNA recombinase
LAVNGLLEQNRHGYTTIREHEDAPLKRFLKCDTCGNYITAYKSTKIQQYYYKCRLKGCKCNKRADDLHQRIRELIDCFTLNVNADTEAIILRTMQAMYNDKNKENEALRIDLENQLSEVDRKIKRLEERYIMEEIDRDLFSRFKSQFLEERGFLAEQAAKSQKGSSNLESCLKSAVRYSRKLATMWAFGNFNEKQALQKILFPRGISYNREKDQVRTSDINTVFYLIDKLSGGWDQKKCAELLLKVTPRTRWSRRDSNPRPNRCIVSFLHAYS